MKRFLVPPLLSIVLLASVTNAAERDPGEGCPWIPSISVRRVASIDTIQMSNWGVMLDFTIYQMLAEPPTSGGIPVRLMVRFASADGAVNSMMVDGSISKTGPQKGIAVDFALMESGMMGGTQSVSRYRILAPDFPLGTSGSAAAYPATLMLPDGTEMPSELTNLLH